MEKDSNFFMPSKLLKAQKRFLKVSLANPPFTITRAGYLVSKHSP